MPRGGCLPPPMPALTQGSVLQLLWALGLDVLMLHKVTCGEGRPAQCPPGAHQPPRAWPHCPGGARGGCLGTCSFMAISLTLLLQQIQLLLARRRQHPPWLLGGKSPEPPAPPGAPQPTSAWGRQRARTPLPQGGSPGRVRGPGEPSSPQPCALTARPCSFFRAAIRSLSCCQYSTSRSAGRWGAQAWGALPSGQGAASSSPCQAPRLPSKASCCSPAQSPPREAPRHGARRHRGGTSASAQPQLGRGAARAAGWGQNGTSAPGPPCPAHLRTSALSSWLSLRRPRCCLGEPERIKVTDFEQRC